MDVATVQTMYAYNDWATDRILRALEELSPDDLNKTLPSSFPTLRSTFAHIVGAEKIWLHRWQELPPTGFPEWVKTGDLATIAHELGAVRAARAAPLAALTDAELARVANYTNIKGDVTWTLRVGDMLLHVCNHATYHRGQLTSMIRQLGVAPPQTDYLLFASGKR